jgi:hypothetical protein
METNDSVRYANKPVTLSFWAKAGANYSSASSALGVQWTTGTGTDQRVIDGYTGASNIVATNATLTTSWQRFSFTGTAASNTNEMGFLIYNTPVGTAGANDWFEITGVQVEFGSVATNFKRAGGGTIQGELAACQRYYYRQTPSGSFGWVAFGLASGTTGGAVGTTFPTQMRVRPTAIEYASLDACDAASTVALTSLTLDTNVSSPNVGVCNFGVAAGLTAFRPYYLRQSTNPAGYLAFTSEL